jgi:uncharacterized membrane protein
MAPAKKQEKQENPPLKEVATHSQNDKIIAALGYIWILCLLPILLKRESKYCQYHGKQGLVLFVASFVVMVLGMIPILGWLIVLPLGWLLIVILSLLGIINALQGRYWEMPFLGKYAQKLNF